MDHRRIIKMPIIDLYDTRYSGRYNPDTQKYEHEYTCINNGLTPKQQTFKDLKWKKGNREFECRVCRKNRSKATRYIGGNWSKICFHCVEQWCKNSTKTLEKINETINGLKSDLDTNKELWEKEELVGALDVK